MTDNRSKTLRKLGHISPSAELLGGIKQAKLREFTGSRRVADHTITPEQHKATDTIEDNVAGLEGLPMIMRFPPDSYRNVEPARLDEWKKEVETKLGERLNIGSDFGATESFSRNEDENASSKSDYDADSATNRSSPALTDKQGHQHLWPSTPVILGFPPIAIERVSKPSLSDWRKLIEDRLGIRGIDFMDAAAGTETKSWCNEYPGGPGGPHILYACDCDMDG